MTLLEPRTWRHTILQGSDEETLRDLRAEAAALAKKVESLAPRKGVVVAAGLMGDDDPYAAAVAEHRAAALRADEFADEAAPRGVTVVLRSLGRKKWKDLVNEHEAREGNDVDKAAGFNTDTFPEALVPISIGSISGSNSFTTDDVEELLDALTDAQYDLFATMAFSLNQRLGANPKDRLLSEPAES